MRQWLEQNQTAVTIGVILLLLVAGAFAMRSFMSGPKIGPPSQRYYLDLTTGQWFVATHSPVPPPSKEGNPSARAYMFSCGDCRNRDSLILGWAERELSSSEWTAMGIEDEIDAQQVSADGREWYSVGSREGQYIQQPPQCEDGTPARPCQP
jgi:hypothetical protein